MFCSQSDISFAPIPWTKMLISQICLLGPSKLQNFVQIAYVGSYAYFINLLDYHSNKQDNQPSI